MRILFLCLMVFATLGSADPIEQTSLSEVQAFIQELSPGQRKLLTDFLRTMVESYSGYTVYGDKPMALEGYAIYPFGATFAPFPSTISKIKGIELWKDLNVPLHDKEYLFVIFHANKYCHLVSINRRAFLKTVNENISLFRYVLGPSLTAENLLQNLIDAGDDFYHVLKDDNALLGILLGYGTQNSINHARDEIVIDANGCTRTDKFPFLSQTMLMHCSQLPKAAIHTPSLGFQTLNQEHKMFEESMKISRDLKPFQEYPIPFFTCDPNSKETQDLLTTYEQNRKAVIRALEEDDFLEQTLCKLFTTTSGTVEVSRIPEERDLFMQEDPEEMVSVLTSWIHRLIKWEGGGPLSKAYLRGITDREENKQAITASPHPMLMWQTERDLRCAENLAKADIFFKRLNENQHLTTLIPNRVLYRTLSEGSKRPLSRRAKSVTFHYSFRFQGETKYRDCGTVQQERLEYLIPGIANVLIGMKPGEERRVFIHPSYGYGENSFFPPNQAIIAQIQLIRFEEEDREVAISSPHILGNRNYKELKTQLGALKEKEFYHYGMEFWDQVKKSSFTDYQTFKRHFNADQKDLDPVFETVDQVCRFVNDLEYRLVCLQK